MPLDPSLRVKIGLAATSGRSPLPITDSLDIGNNVSTEKNCFPLPFKVNHDLLDQSSAHRVQTTHRFIQDKKFRPVHQCTGNH